VFRLLIASAFLACYAIATKMRLPAWRDLPQIALAAVLGITIYYISLNTGEMTVTAGSASLIINLAPVLSALFAVAFLGERLRLLGWIGIAISFGGVILVTIGEGKAFGIEPAALLVLLAAISTALYAVLQKPILKKYRGIEFASYAIWIGTLFSLPLFPGLPEQITTAPANATFAVIYLAIFPAALANIGWSMALSRTKVSNLATLLLLTPIVAIAIAAVWLGEIPSILSLIGGVVSLAGVLLFSLYGHAPSTVVMPAEEPFPLTEESAEL
jgi:drug/metabolite transporter (DMT)-like permease